MPNGSRSGRCNEDPLPSDDIARVILGPHDQRGRVTGQICQSTFWPRCDSPACEIGGGGGPFEGLHTCNDVGQRGGLTGGFPRRLSRSRTVTLAPAAVYLGAIHLFCSNACPSSSGFQHGRKVVGSFGQAAQVHGDKIENVSTLACGEVLPMTSFVAFDRKGKRHV